MDHRLGHDHAGGRAARHYQPAVREIFPQLRARRAGASPRLAGARSLQPRARPLRDQRALVADPFGRIPPDPLDTCGGNDKDRPWTRRFHQLDTPYLAAPACGRRRARGRRPGAVHAPACRPCRLEYDAARRALGADVPERKVPVFARRRRLLGRAEESRRPPTRVTWLTRTACSRWCNRARPCWSTTATTSPPSCRSRLRPAIRPAMSLFRLADAGRRAVFCGDVIHHASQVYARIGTTWRTSGRTTPRCRAGACWSSCAAARCAAVSDPFRRAACGADRARAGRLLGTVRARHDVKRAGRMCSVVIAGLDLAIHLLRNRFIAKIHGPAGQARG